MVQENDCGDFFRVVVYAGTRIKSVTPFGTDEDAARLALRELQAANEAAVIYNGNEAA